MSILPSPHSGVPRWAYALMLLLPRICEAFASHEPKIDTIVSSSYTVSVPLLTPKVALEPVDTNLRVTLQPPSPGYYIHFYRVHFHDYYFDYTEEHINPVRPEANRSSMDPSLRIPTARLFWVDIGNAASTKLGEIVQGFFPKATILSWTKDTEETKAMADLQFRSTMNADLLESENHHVIGIKLIISLSVVDDDGNALIALEGRGIGRHRQKMYWSERTVWNDMSTQALQQAFGELLSNFQSDQRLAQLIKERARARALPASLETRAEFSDADALFSNGKLDSGETGDLLIRIANQGPGPAYDVEVQAISDQTGVELSRPEPIGDLKPGQDKEVAVRVRGGLSLSTGSVRLRVETVEKRGYGARPVIVEVPTNQLVPPRLEIVDISLSDRLSDRSQGDGDGQPSNGETLEAMVRVRNAGPGDAVGVTVTMTSTKVAAEVLEGKAILPLIPANQVEEARLLFRLPIWLHASELHLSFQTTEVRGAQVASAKKDQVWKVRAKRPGVELSYRLYDGNSTDSAGNRDGLVNNGERIEVALTPNNRGDLPAHGVRISIESEDPILTPRPAILEIGDLPMQAEGAVQRFAFDVPRSYNKDQAREQLRFSLSISQKDFPSRREPLGLSFVRLRPALSLESSIPAVLSRGAGGELVLQLRNSGTLRADDVTLEVTSETVGVDLLDERGVPVSSKKMSYGALEAQGVAQERRVRINVRRNAPTGIALVRFTVLQKDFPGLVKQAELSVADEPATVIAVATPEAPVRVDSPPLTAGAPATISFLRNTPGEHLIAEAIVLRFEVQSSTGMAEVRLTQNDRLVPLDAVRRTSSTAGGLQAEQYEVPVQLEEGENRFEVVAITRQGLRSARPLKLVRDREVGRLWVVAVGVGSFQDATIPRLQYPEADAQAVYNYFRDTFGLPENQIFLRINEQATLRDVKSVLGTQLVARANDPRDTVVLYFAGHGMRDRLVGSLDPDGLSKYFLPFDANRNDLYSTALEMDEVTNILRRLTPERVIVILDTCFSGAAGGRSPYDPKSGGERAPISNEFLDRMAHIGKGRVVLSASGPEEVAQESSDFGHGVFTHFLLEGLRGAADMNGDGNIDVHEVYGYVSERVMRTTKGRQNPKLKEPDLVGQILIGRGAVRSRH